MENEPMDLSGRFKDKLLLTITEAGRLLRVSRWSIYQLLNARKLESITIGRRRLIPMASLDQLIKRLRGEGAA